MNEEVGDVRAELVLRPYNSEIVLRQVALGLQPIVLIEGEEEGDNIIFKIDATGLEQDDLANILTLLGQTVKEMVNE